MCKFLVKISTVLYLLSLIACSTIYNRESTVYLPIGATRGTAERIADSLWKDNFVQKISDKFPNFNPLKNPQTQGIYLFYPLVPSPESEIFIRLTIYYTGKLDNAEEIIKYGKTIVQKAVEDYFKNKI